MSVLRFRPFTAGPAAVYGWTLVLAFLLLVSGTGIQHSVASLVIETVYGPFYSLNARVKKVFTVYQENQWLLARTIELSARNARLAETGRENTRLRGLLEFKTKSDLSVVPAEVVGSPSGPLGGIIWISPQPGRLLRMGSPVMAPEGLVGSVSGYAGSLAVVRSLWDRECRVAALDRRSRAAGIIEWVSGPHLTLEYVPVDADVVAGDTIVSSGWGERFPEGLPIGEVCAVEFDSTSFFLDVEVKPFVRFATLEDVFVIQDAGP